jgi:hypothetical protein
MSRTQATGHNNAASRQTQWIAILRRSWKKPGGRGRKNGASKASAFPYLAAITVMATLALWAAWQFEIRKTDHSAMLEGPGLVSWRSLVKVDYTHAKDRIALRFDDRIKALDGKEVNLRGFITPLASTGDQQHFILSSKPPTCPYCLPAGPDEMVEVFSRTPVRYSFDPITVSGRFELLSDDASGLYYRMTDAQPVVRGG